MIRIFRHYISRLAILILAGGITVLLTAAGVGYWRMDWLGDGSFGLKIAALISITILLFYLSDLYNFQLQWGGGQLTLRVGIASAIAGVLVAAIGYAIPPLRFGRMAFLLITIASTLGLMVFRLVTRHLLSHRTLQKRILVLGTALADVVLAWECHYGALPFRVIGFLDDDPSAQDNLLPGYALLGSIKDLLSIVEEHHPDILLVALTDMRGTLPINGILECRFRGVRIEEWTSFFEKLTGRILINSLRLAWLVFSDGAVNTRFAETIRRVFDVALSLVGLCLAAPILGAAALCIKLVRSGPSCSARSAWAKMGGYSLYINCARCM